MYTHKYTDDAVGNLPSIMDQSELVSVDGLAVFVAHQLVRGEVVVLTNGHHQFSKEGGVRHVARPQALLVQHGNDPLVPLLHKVTDDLVVKVLHRLPLESQCIELLGLVILKDPLPCKLHSLVNLHQTS